MTYLCKDCRIRFDKSTAYKDHRRRKHSRYSCSDCNKIFGQRKKYLHHIRTCRLRKNNNNNQRHDPDREPKMYKLIPIVTAEELDVQFDSYLNRKFGKKGIFPTEKMCKFCSYSFVMASDFADHIREHYQAIVIDATGVKSKFDFMHLMGLKIKENTAADNVREQARNQITECKVVITGERCKICDQFFKCRTDLDAHSKEIHPSYKRDEVTLILRIGEEIISRIPLEKCYLRSSKRPQSRLQSDEIYKATEHSLSVTEEDMETTETWSGLESTLDDKNFGLSPDWPLILEENLQSAITSENRSWAFRTRNNMNQTTGNMKRCQEARGKEIVDELELDSPDGGKDNFCAESDFEKGSWNLEFGRIYSDDFLTPSNLRFSGQLKDEVSDKFETSLYPMMKTEEEGVDGSDERSCFCVGPNQPRITPAPRGRSLWEQEYYDILNDESGNFHEMSIHGSPPSYKYGFQPKTEHFDHSFSPDEMSYGLQVKEEDDHQSNRNIDESCMTTTGYTDAIIADKEATNSSIIHPRCIVNPSDADSFRLSDNSLLETSKTYVDKIGECPRVLIKEELMIEEGIFYASEEVG